MPDHPQQPVPLDYAGPERRARRPTGCIWWALGAVALLALAIAVLLPQMGRQREPAKRVICRANLRSIGQAVALYAREHAGAFPADFGEMFVCADVAPQSFICPSSSDNTATGPTTAAILADLTKPGRCSYIYLGKGLSTTCPAPTIIAYEPLANHANEGMNALFGDGHVEWLPAAEAKRVLAELQAGFNPPRPPPAQSRPTP